MAGHGKGMVERDWVVGFNLFFNYSEISIEAETEQWNDKSYILQEMSDNQTNAETELIKKDCFEHLSNEAKEICNLIFNSSAEVLALIKSPTYNRISQSRIKKLLKKRGWEELTIYRSFKELTEMTKLF